MVPRMQIGFASDDFSGAAFVHPLVCRVAYAAERRQRRGALGTILSLPNALCFGHQVLRCAGWQIRRCMAVRLSS